MGVTTVNFDASKNLATVQTNEGSEVTDELLNSSEIITSEKDIGKDDLPKEARKETDALQALVDELEGDKIAEGLAKIKVKDIMGVVTSEPQYFLLPPTTTFGGFFIDVSRRFNLEIAQMDLIYQTKDFAMSLGTYTDEHTFLDIGIVACQDRVYPIFLEVVKSNKKRKSKDVFRPSHDMVQGADKPDNYDLSGTHDLSPSIRREFVGLKNRNMTCYLNSFLQGLWFTPEFRNLIYSYDHDPARSERKSICAPLQKLFLFLQLSTRDSIETDDLIRTFGWADRETWMQHDIEELFSIVMESITKELAGTSLDGIIQALYFGNLYDYVKCLECNKGSERVDIFLVVPLPIRNFGTPLPSPTLEAALNSFVAYEVLDGNNMYNCANCAKACCAHKGFKFNKLPYILTFQLKRFEFDYERNKRLKLNDKVIFPTILDMNPYIEKPAGDRKEALKTETLMPKSMKEGLERKTHTRPSIQLVDSEETAPEVSASGATITPEKPSFDTMKEMVETKGPEIYQLYGVMVHRGGINSGHYFAYILDLERDKWFRCDDAVVRQASLEDIQSTYGGEREEDKEWLSAYMLLYRRFDPNLNLLPYHLDEMPVNMQNMWKELESVDKQLREDEELEKNSHRTTCFAYADNGSLIEKVIQIPKQLKLGEAAKYVQQDYGKEIAYQAGSVRLVRYDRDLEIIENSFENYEEELLTTVLKKVPPRTKNEGLLLEWTSDAAGFTEVHKVNDIIFRTQTVDLGRQEMAGHIKEIHVEPSAPMGCLKSKLNKALMLPAEKTEMVMVALYAGRFTTLFGDDNHPLSLFTFDKINNLYVHVGPSNMETGDQLFDFVERYTKAEVMHMYIQLPTEVSIEHLLKAKEQDASAQIQTTQSKATDAAQPSSEASKEQKKVPELSAANGQVNADNQNDDKTQAAKGGEPEVPARPQYFMKLMTAIRVEQDNLALCEIRIDGQTPLYVLSKQISSWIPVKETDFVIYKIEKDESTELRRLTERITTIKPFDHLYVKLEHRLQEGEARLPVYKLNIGLETNPLEYLSDIVVTLAMTVDEVKKAIVEKMENCDPKTIDMSKVRIRKKIRTSPSKVLRPNTKIQDAFTASSIHCGELYVQMLSEPCVLTDKTYCLIYRRWRPSTGVLDTPKEIAVFHDYSTDFEDVLLAKLKESMGEDFEVEVAKPDGISYPWQMSPRVIQDLAWFPLVPPVRKSLYVYSDELVLLVRDKNEVPMDFSDQPERNGEDDMDAYRPKNVLKTLPAPNNDRRETGLKLNLSPVKK